MDVFGGAPRVLAYPRPVLVISGADAVLNCQIVGDPQPDVIWERKNEPIFPEGRYRIAQNDKMYTLYISGVTIQDAGQYICKAKNSIGETYAAATLKVEEEKQELQQTQQQQQQQQQQQDVKVVSPEQELKIKKQQQLELVHEADPFQDNKPRFLIKPLSLRIDKGEDAAFSCKLWGDPLPAVVWAKDGKQLNEIYESAHYHVGQQDGGWFQLKVFRTRAPDGGVYTCKAVNEHGEAMAGAVLLIEPIPDQREGNVTNGYTNGHWSPHQSKEMHSRAKHSKQPHLNVAKAKKFTVTEGKNAKFRCYVTGKPKPEIVWKKDGESVVPDRRHLIYEDREGYYTLKVLYCKQQDTGLYICAASNVLGNTLSAVHLSVKGPKVRFKRALRDVEVRERDVAVLECEVPEESISTAWYMEDQRLQPGNKYSMEQKGTCRLLTIRDVGADDDGVYLCEMPDGGKSIAELAVKGTIVKKLPRRLEVMEGENAAFCVEVEEDEMEIFWFKDGLQLRETHQTIIKSFGKTHILVFVNTSYQDSGTIAFMAGRSKTSCKLRVKAARHCPPICPVSVQMKTDYPNGAILSWTPSPNLQNSSKSVYVLERQEVGSQEWQRCLTMETGTSAEVLGDSVPCEGDYRFRISCVNKYGRSGHVEFPNIVHLVPGPKIKTPLKNAVVAIGEDAVFFIELSTSMIGTWFLNSTQLQESECFSITQSKNEHILQIHQVLDVFDGAEITFIATGVRDSAVLQIITPVVKFLPLSEMDTKKNIEVGNPIVLYCEVSHPTAIVRWFKDEQELHLQDGLNIQSDGNMRRIVIQSAEYSHSGVYTCQLNNDTLAFNVNVEAPCSVFESLSEAERKRSVEAGDPIVLHCKVSNPEAEVCWFSNGKPLSPQDGIDIQTNGNIRTLIIQSADFNNSGIYSCQSADDVAVFHVDISVPPVSFKEVPQEERQKSTMELDPVVLTCELSRPDANACWFKDGTEVLQSDNITIQSEGTMRRLIIRSAELVDAGMYTCQAGDHTTSFSVNIKEPPVTIVDPKDDVHIERYVSEEIVLNCELSRSNGETHWFKDGLKLQENENIRLSAEGPYRRVTILCASRWDSGEYVCETGGDSVFFQLIITEAPVCIVHPSESEVEMCILSSERLILSCEISKAEAEVCWYRDGMEVEENDNLILENDGSYRRLVIPCATIDDSAEYACETADDSVIFMVTIQEPPVKLSCSKETGSITESFSGDPVVLELEVSRDNAEVCWMKDGVKVEESSNITLTENGLIRKLTIHCPTLKDSGIYTCNAIDETMDFKVKITEAPVKLLNKDEIKTEHKAVLYDDIVLECELSRANSEVNWYKNGRPIEENERFCFEEEGAFRSLVILCAELQDSGEYILYTKDDMISFHVIVQEPLVKITSNSGGPDYQEMVTGEDLILACEVSRANAPVQWLFNDKPLVPDERIHIECLGTLRKLILSNILLSDSGKYMCDAVDDKMITIVKVQEPPVNFLNKEEVNLVTGYEAESVTMTALVSRHNAQVRWLKDWTPVIGDRFHITSQGLTRTFTIDPLKRSDVGEYTCDANTDEMHFSLLVKEMRIKFVKTLVDTVAHKDGMITLRCELCKAKADVQWLKDGVEIIPSRRFTIRADGPERSLTIHRITEEDAGEYACESKDDCTSARVKVQLPRVVEFLTELHNTTVMEGEDATFKCVVSPDDVQLVWLMDGEPIKPSDRFHMEQNSLCHTLNIRKVQLLDSSRITAEAEGIISKASLKVQEAQVMFTKRMEAVMAEEFGEAMLETEVSLESGEVQWIRQGVVIQPGPRHKLTQNGCKRILNITNLSLSDRGTYRCETLHDRTQVKLNVEPRKIIIRKGLMDTETFERETASFEVELSHADVEGVWQKDGLRVKPGNTCRVSSNGRVHGLTLSNLTLEDTGSIVFSAEGLRSTARLLVKETPVIIIKKLSDVRFEEGSSVTLECELSRKNVDVKWQKNGLELKSNKALRIYSMGHKRYLQILECSSSDSGIYTCDIGDLSTFCKLEVYERELEIITGLEDLCIKEDQNAVFMCELSKEDMPGEWYKDGNRIRPTSTIKTRREGTKHFLLICDVKAEDSGEIKFVSKQVESVAYLDVEELPASIVRPLRDRTALENHRVILECTVSSPRCDVTWYKEDVELESTEHKEIIKEGCYHKLVIHQVALEDEGTYSIEVGELTSAAKLMVEAQSILVVKCLEDVEVKTPEPACFQCETSVILIKPPIWTLNGETLQSGPNIRLESQGNVHKLTFKKTTSDMSGTVKFSTGKAKTSAKLTVLQ
ncbi:obscurin-like protein 1a isoform X1 [Myxocyprinus asiaticus]|uniref:obscurin-like protein 1a isoform X1 n=1 Tax=Myxocyprinus asiaticus TaxID=70543 RepID=UPI0022216AFF|nr:obscurin-like protein 1a isoform X1 [Myxocyprinus asiaticus]